MRTLFTVAILAGFGVLSGCVVVPARGYVVRPRVVAVAPAPIVVVRPYYRYRW
jgi:hypothetical protein